jgi:hypothetical protein
MALTAAQLTPSAFASSAPLEQRAEVTREHLTSSFGLDQEQDALSSGGSRFPQSLPSYYHSPGFAPQHQHAPSNRNSSRPMRMLDYSASDGSISATQAYTRPPERAQLSPADQQLFDRVGNKVGSAYDRFRASPHHTQLIKVCLE